MVSLSDDSTQELDTLSGLHSPTAFSETFVGKAIAYFVDKARPGRQSTSEGSASTIGRCWYVQTFVFNARWDVT